MQKNSGSYSKALLFLVIGGLIGWIANASLAESSLSHAPSTTAPDFVDMDLFWNVWNEVAENYVDTEKIDTQKQVYGAIAGMVDSLEDPYSVYMTPEETEQFQSSLAGELEGIGAELTVEEGQLLVLSPLKDSPAEQAGLLPKDYIYMVDGETTSDMTLWEAIMNIRGEPNTDVTLTIIREGVDEPMEITITRQKIDLPSVEIEFIEEGGKDIAHLSIYQFGDDTTKEFESAMREITLEDPDALVLDLRMNGGGYLNASIDIMSAFFEEAQPGVIVKRRNSEDEILQTSGNGTLKDLPMVVLIDEGSASASEILAGALQDYGRAVLMGEQSFGKGSVQELDDLSDGSSLRLTIAKWYTPKDRSINETGITPDISIPMESGQIDTEQDVQLDAALDYLIKL